MAEIGTHIQVTLNELERNFSRFMIDDYVTACENQFDKRVEKIAERILCDSRIRAVFISGPTASGKTTFNKKLSDSLGKSGKHTVTLSLDDYYFSHKFKTDKYGRHDFESLDTLDIPLILSNINDLISGKAIRIPRFDFLTKQRIEAVAQTVMDEKGILLVEGLHGLSKTISGHIEKDRWLGVFIMPYATLNDDFRLLDSRDIRILRRVARDSLNRGADALSTIDYWPMLDSAETTSFPEYLSNADIYINSALPYEFYCVAPLAGDLIASSLNNYREGVRYASRLTSSGDFAQIELAIETAQRLHKAASLLPRINPAMIPASSLLNEFIRKDINP